MTMDLAEDLPHLLGDDAGDDVARTAGGEGHHHGDGPRRIVLRCGDTVPRRYQHDGDAAQTLSGLMAVFMTRGADFARRRIFQSFFKTSATSTRRPSRAERMPARTTASERVA